jgi:ribonucleoside-diphosphate reductase alpha chain
MKACVNCEGEDGDCFEVTKPQSSAEAGSARGQKSAGTGELHSPASFSSRARATKMIEFSTYDTDWDSEAYLVPCQARTPTTRCASPMISCDVGGTGWRLGSEIERTTRGKVHKTEERSDLWEKIGYSAWASADPGLHYHTRR